MLHWEVPNCLHPCSQCYRNPHVIDTLTLVHADATVRTGDWFRIIADLTHRQKRNRQCYLWPLNHNCQWRLWLSICLAEERVHFIPLKRREGVWWLHHSTDAATCVSTWHKLVEGLFNLNVSWLHLPESLKPVSPVLQVHTRLNVTLYLLHGHAYYTPFPIPRYAIPFLNCPHVNSCFKLSYSTSCNNYTLTCSQSFNFFVILASGTVGAWLARFLPTTDLYNVIVTTTTKLLRY